MVTDTLVLSGGGVKGISMLGAAASLSLENVTTFVGVSVGSIVATVLAMKMNPRDVFLHHVANFKYEVDVDITRLDKSFGLDSGKYMEKWIADIVPDLTFAEFHQRFGSTLVVVATNLNLHRPVYFSHTSHPTLHVRRALRMSCSIPLYFSAVTYEGHLYVDGGLTDNFPYDHAMTLTSQGVLGIKFKSSPRDTHHAWTFEHFLGSLIEANVNTSGPAPPNVLELRTGMTQSTQFKLTTKEKKILYDSGYDQAQLFMKKNV